MDDAERAARREKYRGICGAYCPASDTDNQCSYLDGAGSQTCRYFGDGAAENPMGFCGVLLAITQPKQPQAAPMEPAVKPATVIPPPLAVMPRERRVFSYSQVSLAATCMYRWHLRYDLDIKPPPGKALLIGGYFHGLLAAAKMGGPATPLAGPPEGLSPYDAAMTLAMAEALVPLLPDTGNYSYEEEFETVVDGLPFRGYIDRIDYANKSLEEHKTVGNMDEWSIMYVVQQTALYLHAKQTVEKAIVNVFAKPGLRPRKDESPGDFGARCLADMRKKPKAYFAAVTLTRSEIDVDKHVGDIAIKAHRLSQAIDRREFDRAANTMTCGRCDWKAECIRRLRDQA